MAKMVSFLLALGLAAGSAFGSEMWAFRFNSISLAQSTSWHDDLVFHNTTAQDAVVRLLGVSNGGVAPGYPTEVSVPAGRTVSMKEHFGVWESPDAMLWVVHLDVPESVLTYSRGGAHAECPSPCGAPPNPFPNLGAFSMPVFHSLVPAGQAQIHMGADLGFQKSRVNIGIYNSGASIATAAIVLRQACDDSVLESRMVSVPADTVLQFGGFGSLETSCDARDFENIWLRYVTVTVDQPSLSYIVNLLEPLPFYPRILLSVPIGP